MFYVMCPIAVINAVIRSVDIIDDDVTENHCVSNCSSTKNCLE